VLADDHAAEPEVAVIEPAAFNGLPIVASS